MDSRKEWMLEEANKQKTEFEAEDKRKEGEPKSKSKCTNTTRKEVSRRENTVKYHEIMYDVVSDGEEGS